jgi:hypothetical protein
MMTWLDKVERRFGFLGIPGLTRILVGFTALVFALAWLAPGFVSVLDLDPARIRHGEVWRLFAYIFIPQTLSPWWILFALCRDDRHNDRRIFLRRQIFQFNALRIFLFRFREVLSG